MSDAAQAWEAGETYRAPSIADLLDPVALEARLVDARKRRALALAARAAVASCGPDERAPVRGRGARLVPLGLVAVAIAAVSVAAVPAIIRDAAPAGPWIAVGDTPTAPFAPAPMVRLDRRALSAAPPLQPALAAVAPPVPGRELPPPAIEPARGRPAAGFGGAGSAATSFARAAYPTIGAFEAGWVHGAPVVPRFWAPGGASDESPPVAVGEVPLWPWLRMAAGWPYDAAPARSDAGTGTAATERGAGPGPRAEESRPAAKPGAGGERRVDRSKPAVRAQQAEKHGLGAIARDVRAAFAPRDKGPATGARAAAADRGGHGGAAARGATSRGKAAAAGFGAGPGGGKDRGKSQKARGPGDNGRSKGASGGLGKGHR